jgi:hypothetical protein
VNTEYVLLPHPSRRFNALLQRFPGDLQQSKRLSPRTPVILVTAHDEECRRDRRAGLAAARVGKAENLAEFKRIVA